MRLLLVVALFAAACAHSPASAGREVEARGWAPGAGPRARSAALADARRRALETLGVRLRATSVVRAGAGESSEVRARTSGALTGERVLWEGPEEGGWAVRLRARVEPRGGPSAVVAVSGTDASAASGARRALAERGLSPGEDPELIVEVLAAASRPAPESDLEGMRSARAVVTLAARRPGGPVLAEETGSAAALHPALEAARASAVERAAYEAGRALAGSLSGSF